MNVQEPTGLIDVDEARRIVLARTKPLPVVEMPLAAALHRTLATPIFCDADYPPFDRSIMDGYAVRAADVATTPRTLPVVGIIAAGHLAGRALAAGEAMEINTGASLPAGADAVVRKEDTEHRAGSGEVLIRVPAAPGRFVALRGSYRRAGDTAVAAGSVLTPPEIAAAAACGAARVSVYRTPTVAILVTGDELIPIDQKPAGAQIRDSNRYLLEASILAAFAEPVPLGAAKDDRDAITAAVAAGLACDVLCVTGGVSVGDFDLVPEALQRAGAERHIHRIAIKPGRPILFATAPGGKLIFALPGNPVSAMVGFELLVRPALAALQGRRDEAPPLIEARLVDSLKASERRRSYSPAQVRVDAGGTLEVRPLSWYGSGDPFGVVGANAFIMRPPGSPPAVTGDRVLVLPLGLPSAGACAPGGG